MTIAMIDAINPSAIAMTIVILSSENQKILKALLYTLGIFLSSLTVGLILSIMFDYYGENLINFFDFKSNIKPEFVDKFITDTNPLNILYLFILEIMLGLGAIYLAVKNRKKSIVTKIKNYTDKNIFGALKLGIVVTGIEVSTGLPYIGAITTLHLKEYNWVTIIFTLIAYNFTFVLPILSLIILNKYFRTQFDIFSVTLIKVIELIIQFFKFYILLILGVISTFIGVLGVYTVLSKW